MSYKATLDSHKAFLDAFERKIAEISAPNPFVARGYCPLATAVDRAAAAYFPEEYSATEIRPQQRDRLARHHRAIEDIARLDAWERDAERRRSEAERRRKHAENARRASATNVNSLPRRASVHWSETSPPAETSIPGRPMSEDQEKAARLDAIEDDEVISTRQRTERQEALKDAAWKRLRQELHDGKLVGFVQGNDGGHPKEIEASKWSGRWAENAHKQDAFLNTLVREDELAALLGEGQPQAHTDAAPKMSRSSTSGPTGSAEPPLRSGLPGRPSSKELYLVELERRASAGELAGSAAAESRYLHRWLPQAHPGHPSSGLGAIENFIRPHFRQYKAASNRDENP